MKKLFTILTICYSLSSFAQLENGTIAPDFTATDINGNSHRLYDYLDNGYSVIMDISATWCPPCWSYHSQHILEDVWASHGPAGEPGVNANTSDDVVVLFFEGDASTNLDQLNGIGAGTLGDWTEGISYPIIDDASISSLYEIGYFPTVYTICTDRTVTESGQLSAEDHFELIQECAVQVTGKNLKVLDYIREVSSCSPASIEMSTEIQNLGTEQVNSFTVKLMDGNTEVASEIFTGTFEPYDRTIVEFGFINIDATTNFTILLEEEDNLSSDNQLTQEITAGTMDQQAIVKVTTDNFGAQCSWKILDENGSTVANGGPYTNHSNTFSFVQQVQDDQEINLTQSGCYSFEVIDNGNNGMFTIQPTFFSIVDSQGNTIVNINGDEYTSSIVKDFTNISTSTSINENKNTLFNVYPNPAYDMINIEFDSQFEKENATISISNMLGKEVIALNNIISNNTSIDISSLKNGIYFVNTSVKGNISTEKIVILK
ncbi:MAG: T9SS type A sorting domain-containing protein [Flavobacteriales bacterium]